MPRWQRRALRAKKHEEETQMEWEEVRPQEEERPKHGKKDKKDKEAKKDKKDKDGKKKPKHHHVPRSAKLIPLVGGCVILAHFFFLYKLSQSQAQVKALVGNFKDEKKTAKKCHMKKVAVAQQPAQIQSVSYVFEY